MKSFISLIICCIFISNQNYSQAKLVKEKSVLFNFIVNSIDFKLLDFGNYKRNAVLNKQDEHIKDTLQINYSKFFIDNNAPIICLCSKDKITIYSFQNGIIYINAVDDNSNVVGFSGNRIILYKEEHKSQIPILKISEIDIIGTNKKIIFEREIEKLFNYSDQTYADSFYSPLNNTILIITGLDPGEGGLGEPFECVKIDLNTKNTFNLDFLDSLKIRNWREMKLFQDLNFIRLNYEIDDIMANPIVHKNYILNQDFSLLRETLIRQFEIKGYEINNGAVRGTMITAKLDDRRTDVIIEINNTEWFDNLQYQLYQDKVLSGNLDTLSKNDLDVLRNFIFARHNYTFDSEYYQAYFNSFEFYSNEAARKSRTKDVDRLLTPADKKNLELIRKASRRFN